MDTIFALATAPGRAGVAIVRVSGPDAWRAAESVAGTLPDQRVAGFRTFRHPESGATIDEGLLLVFSENGSYTGEKTVEFQIHGSIATTNQLLSVLADMTGLRLAEAGEFTLRAFQNGRMDLTQVDGLGDLINAETDLQLDQAMRVLSGDLSTLVNGWRQRLVSVLGLIAASIDFSDEEIPDDILDGMRSDLELLRFDLDREQKKFATAQTVRDGFEIAIVGRPNVGKSTLLNYIAERDAAIVTDIPGTTRDVIEVHMHLAGVPVTFLDTAGLRVTEDTVESLGVSRSRDRAAKADMRLFLLNSADELNTLDMSPHAEDMVLTAKGDLFPGPNAISGKTGAGIDDMLAGLETRLSEMVQEPASVTHLRHKICISRAIGDLTEAEALFSGTEIDPELVSFHVSSAVSALDSLIGKIDVEDVLGSVFAEFCVGK